MLTTILEDYIDEIQIDSSILEKRPSVKSTTACKVVDTIFESEENYMSNDFRNSCGRLEIEIIYNS